MAVVEAACGAPGGVVTDGVVAVVGVLSEVDGVLGAENKHMGDDTCKKSKRRKFFRETYNIIYSKFTLFIVRAKTQKEKKRRKMRQ